MVSSDPYKPRKTRLRIVGGMGETVKSVDLTDVPNANVQCLGIINIEQQCDMLHWHVVSALELPAYG